MADVSDEAEPAAAEGPPVGTVLEGRYRLVGRLGEGGVGWVYRAEHLKLGTDVAIKMLQAPYAQHEMLRPRFEREARALASLRHPHIVTLTDYSVTEDGHPYLVMERLEGRTLAELIAEGPVEEERAKRILRQILDALIYAHGKGFAHRDLKPTNVFLVELPTDADHVKILDFGFVKLVGGHHGEKPALTRSGIAFGTPSYMCPEQATGGATDPRADLYSAGVVLFEMLAGRRPFVGEIPEVIRQHLTEPVPPLDVGGAAIEATPALRELLERAMAKEPADRFQTAQAMRDAIDGLPSPAVRPIEGRVDGRSPTIPAPAPAGAEPTRPATPATTAAAREGRSGFRIFPWLAALVVVGGLAAIAFALLRDGDEARVEAPREVEDAEPSEAVEPRVDDAVDMDFGAGEEGAPDAPVEAAPVEAEATVDDAWAEVTGGEADGPVEELAAEGAALDGVAAEGAVEEGAGAAGAEGETAVEGGAAPAAEDPWAVREPVPILDEARRRLSTGRPLPRGDEREMRRYVREHRDDPRAHLVLARHFLARGHTLSSVQRYSLAYAVDERARHDPTMLTDLVRLAALPVATDQAADLLARAYGDAAVAPIEEALADDALEAADRRRLEAVRDRLRGGD